ncbi:MAG TPA: hypothetical protein VIK57_05565 [Streptosporangiaceae bacterium]
MNRAHRVRVIIGSGFAAAALAVGAGLPAQAASPTGWRVVSSQHYGSATAYSGLMTVVAPAKKDTWALGGSDLSGATAGTPVAEQWNGAAWQTATLPSGLTSYIEAASAPGSKDIWAVSGLGEYVLHYDGITWSVAKQWAPGGIALQLTGVTAFSPMNVWVFGGPGGDPGLGTWHLHGTTWTQVTGPGGGITTASALSARDIWAIGASSAPQRTIVHYDGTRWQKVASPALSGLQFNRIDALSATNIWLSAMKGSKPALHYTSAGAWSRTLLGTQALVSSFALIPGTTSVWAAGFLPDPTSGGDATVWAHGAAG